MVRIRARDKSAVKVQDGLSQQPARKRKVGESSVPNGGGTEASSPRTSKRTRATQMPYQSPESVGAILSAVVERKKATPKTKNETTPKRDTKKKDMVKTPKKPSKPVKRLKKQASPTKAAVKPPIRRKVLKTPEPVKPAAKAVNPRTNNAAITKKLEKAKKIVTKANGASKPATLSVSGAKKRKSSSTVSKSKQDESAASSSTTIKKTQEGKAKPKRKGKLVAKPDLTYYDKDPTFESKKEIPFISTLSQSRLVIRAIILNDMKMLKKLVLEEPEKIYSLCVPRSPSHEETAFDYICKYENKQAFNILHKIPEKVSEKFGSSPTLMVSAEETGRPSHMMFGHAMRQVSVGRGGKEGNNAFLHDLHNSYNRSWSLSVNGIQTAIEHGASLDFVTFLKEKMSTNQWDYMQLRVPLRKGHYEIAAKIIATANERGGYGFNFLHEEALTKTDSDALTDFKPVSVTKKCTYDPRFSPLHCAAINPNGSILAELLRAMPDYNLADKDGWTVGHYAAVCSGPEPLKHLLKCGISTQAVTSAKRGGDGYTLLHAAVSAGRAHNVKLILEHEKKAQKQKQDAGEANIEEDPKKKQKVLLQNDIRYKLATSGLNALQMACELGHADIVQLLLEAETDANRKTIAKQDCLTPLMLATMHGHLDIVKMLVEEGVKVDDKDKRGRTAAHHAAINGQTHVLSYFLRLGCNHLAVDSSGNTILHYSAAYGWYFATLLSLEAGCPPNATNHWKMTPMAIAFLKGHTGLVTVLMQQEGVDVNAVIDDSSGRTLLLETVSTSWDLSRIKFLVEELKADPKCEDYNKNNALHLLTLNRSISHWAKDFQEQLKQLNECLTYLLEKGCNPVHKNIDEISPILLAASRANFYFISKLLERDVVIPFEKDQQNNTLLHYITTCFKANDQIIYPTFTKLCSNTANIAALKEMAAVHNKSGMTPLLNLVQSLDGHDEEHKTRFQTMVETFLDKFDVDVNAKVEGKGKSQMTALHYAVGTYLLPTILKHKPMLDPVDDKLRTPLAMAVLNNQKEAAEQLINAEANVNFKFKDECNIGLVLYTAMKEQSSYSLIPKLIAKGADPREVHPKTKNSILHYISRKPRVHHAVEAVNAVLAAGVNPNFVNTNGRTALHDVVNERGSETDVFYDIEDALLSAGASLTIKDERGRIPLHYCFVKKGSPLTQSFFDPIELASTLVTAMKSAKVPNFIHAPDVYGSTPLHYAAFRGATICCSYLMQTLPRGGLDVRDNNGNTPFGLSVRNAHEGCALNFFQKDADFLRTINNNIKVEELKTEEATAGGFRNSKPKQEVWQWDHIQEIDEEAERVKELEEKYPILEQIVKNDWQGMLYLMIGQLQESGTGFSCGISTALKLHRLKLALKIAMKVRDKKELAHESGTLFHTLAKYFNGADFEEAEKICETFRKTGLNPASTDKFGAQAAIYALVNRQTSLCDALYVSPKPCTKLLASMKPDLFGRTPFTSLFWNVKSLALIQQPFAIELLAAGGNPNQLCEYPIKLTQLSGVRFSEKLIDITPSSDARYTPLILAVIVNCHQTVKWLLTMKKAGPLPVNVNAQDSEGRTAIMHAVRLNDLKMVKLLLDPANYDYVEDKQKVKTKSTNVDLNIRDNKGWTVMDYLVLSPAFDYPYKNVEPIFQLLQQVGQAVNIVSGDGCKPMARAIMKKRSDHIEMLSKYVAIPPTYKKSFASDHYVSPASVFSQDITSVMPVTDYSTAAAKMAEKLIEEAREKLRKEGKDEVEKPKPDPLCGLEEDNAELMMDEIKNIPYDLLMTKVDLTYGIYGLYNFYKMQLVKQPRGKEMIVLFTEWGRVGQTGQYQKTPFPTAEEAIKEFTKIFKQKNGNAWEDVQTCSPIPNKYRLVPKDLRTVKHSGQVSVNFTELEKAGKNIRSSLPSSILWLIKNLCSVHKDVETAYGGQNFVTYESCANYKDLPLMPTEVLLKGESLLKEIGEKLQKYETMVREIQQSTGKYKENDKVEIMDGIIKLSEDFYQLIPIYSFASQTLVPIMSEHDLREKLVSISRLIHLETAKTLLLGAQYHMGETNPFEYVYRCLGTKIELLDRSNLSDEEEAELILQYIHNTGENAKVYGVYRVEIPKENDRLNDSGIQNRQLLWHGTSSANLLSILQQGLQVAPLGSTISGHLFGKGIYLADIFEKSQHYCRSIEVNGQTRKYMLLCEAALGKIYEVELDKAGEKPMPKTFDSLKTSDSRYEPNPETTVIWKGRTVALGEKVEKPRKDDDGYWYGLDFNEYIVFNPEQVAVRYLIEFED